MNKNKDLICHICSFITVSCWALSYVLAGKILAVYSGPAFSFIRLSCATITVCIFGLIKKIGLPRLKDVYKFFISGGIGITVYSLFYTTGAKTLNGTTTSLMLATIPIFTALLALFFMKERITPLGWAAIVLAFGGILMITLWNGVLKIDIGIIYMLIASVLFSAYNLTQKSLSKTYSPLAVSIYSITAGTVLFLFAAPEAVATAASAPIGITLTIVGIGIFSAGISFLLWTYALANASNISLVTNYMFATPFLTAIFNYIINGSVPDITTFVGGTVIIAALIMFTLCHKKKHQAMEATDEKQQ